MADMLRVLSPKELNACGSILLPIRFWEKGQQIDHPEYGLGKLEMRDELGRMIFRFEVQSNG